MERQGVVVAVCKSEVRAYPKFPQDSAYISDLGVDGDGHATAYRHGFKPRNRIFYRPSERGITIVSDEARKDINEELGLNITPGGFNENLLVRGVGELGDIPDRTRMTFANGVEMVIIEQNFGCYKLNEYHQASMVKATTRRIAPQQFENRRGLVAIVTKPGYLFPGDNFLLHNRPFPVIASPEKAWQSIE